MNEEEFKKIWDNAPKDSNLAILKEAMEEAVVDTINERVKELMATYSLTYGEALLITEKEFKAMEDNK